jgi:putative DNA methylase
MTDDRRLIEDYLPIEAISKEASREKSVRKGHISTLHLWWARRPLVACRAAVYGALVPASRFRPHNGPDEKRESLTRANAAKFVERLCKYPGDAQVIAEAQRHILEAHSERLTQETGKTVTVEDITEGRAPRPKVLDMFAGGGAIPLEALRLGCEAYALDLNPVAHIIELCTLVYPQKYGKPDKNARGSAKDGTWAGLAEEVRYWGNWVLERVRAEIGDLYPSIPDPKAPKIRQVLGKDQLEMTGKGFEQSGQQKLAVETPAGYLTPVAYLWTRTVRCKNPSCRAKVPLVRQTWLCKKKDKSVALRMVAPMGRREVTFEVVEVAGKNPLGFDPEGFSTGGNATCPFCGTVADDTYIRGEGVAGGVSTQLMAMACRRPGQTGKAYVTASEIEAEFLPNDETIKDRIEEVCRVQGVSIPHEPINPLRPSPWTRGVSGLTRHGITNWGEMFLPRQLLCLLVLCKTLKEARRAVLNAGYCPERAGSLTSYLAVLIDKAADYDTAFCRWISQTEAVADTFGRQALAMVWDFAELNPFGPFGSNLKSLIQTISDAVTVAVVSSTAASVSRGTATDLPWPEMSVDAVITDPPYYDNVPYADASDFFYVWLKRTIGDHFPEHFSSELAPKRGEMTALSSRHGGDMRSATLEYEQRMSRTFAEAHRVLKPGAPLVVVYAHKTTLGWSTLIDALRVAGFVVVEAWPLDTERGARLLAIESAALASSIFLVARKRDGDSTGSYDGEVQPELERIVRERVKTLWEMGIGGADLVIACVGAGLRAFTRFARVDYANGEEVPAERFLTEVETVVLEAILARLSNEVSRNGGRNALASVDPWTRFYTLWRYTYKSAELDAGEAIIFANGTHVELDGLRGLSQGSRPLVEKKKGKYRLLDYGARGDDPKLGMPSEDGQSAPLIDGLHRLLWLMERHPSRIPDFLREAQPNAEQLRLVAQALAGPALKGGELGEVATGSELAALTKLTANWRALVEQPAGPLFTQ